MIGGDVEPSVIQRLDLVVFDMVPSALLPVLDTEAEAVRVVFCWPHEEGPSRVGLSKEEFVGLFAGHVRKEPAAT